MNIRKTEKGITLLALVITIILLLIISTVALRTINNKDIIGYAQNATEDFEGVQKEEQQYVTEIGTSAKDNLGGIPVTSEWIDNGDGSFTNGNKTLKIGDYVNYTYDIANDYQLSKVYSGYSTDQVITQTTGVKWRVLGINDKGEIELVSENRVGDWFRFGGATGYNNSVYLLNDICEKQYSNSNLGIKARSINIEDFEKQYNQTGKDARDNYMSGETKYNGTKIYEEGYNYYPTIYAQEKGSGTNGTLKSNGIGRSESLYKNIDELSRAYDNNGNRIETSQTTAKDSQGNASRLIITQTEHMYATGESNTYFDNNTFYNMLLGGYTGYWIASRAVTTGGSSNCALFGLLFTDGTEITREGLYKSNNTSDVGGSPNMIRPVVTLNSNITIIGSGKDIGTVDNMWQLSK